MRLAEAINRALQNERAFVCVRFPGEKLPISSFNVLPKSESDGNQPHFIMSPFDVESAAAIYLEMNDIAKGFDVEFPEIKFKSISNDQVSICSDCWSKQDYLSKTEGLIKKMQEGELKKVVLSRKIAVQLPEKKSWGNIYELLCKQYPEAYVYILNDGNAHTWIGASPETLVELKAGAGTTMALAGTQALNGRNPKDVVWERKERLEQDFVVEYIRDCLLSLGVEQFTESAAQTAIAGHLAHLKSTFSFTLTDKLTVDDLASALHPTPAVCGLPPETALQHIRNIEPHQRLYYAGFAGIKWNQRSASYFVNLRCMQVKGDVACLYVGGGLTADSDSLNEWKETEAKAEVLLSVIAK